MAKTDAANFPFSRMTRTLPWTLAMCGGTWRAQPRTRQGPTHCGGSPVPSGSTSFSPPTSTSRQEWKYLLLIDCWNCCSRLGEFVWYCRVRTGPKPVTLRMATKNFLSYSFLTTYPKAHYLHPSNFNFLLKFCVKILFGKHYFSPLNSDMRKGKDPKPDPDPYLWLTDLDPISPKTCGSGSPTLD